MKFDLYYSWLKLKTIFTYDWENPYFLYFDQTGSAFAGTLKVQAKQVSLFPVIPSVTYNFKF